MSVTHRSDATLLAGYHHSGDRGLGVKGSDVPATGENGPAILYSGINMPAEANDEFRVVITSVPAGLTIFVNEDGSFSASASSAGVYVGGYTAYKNGVLYGSSTYTLTFGDTGEAVEAIDLRFTVPGESLGFKVVYELLEY